MTKEEAATVRAITRKLTGVPFEPGDRVRIKNQRYLKGTVTKVLYDRIEVHIDGDPGLTRFVPKSLELL